MEVEQTLRSISFVVVRFAGFSANALLFGLVPVCLLVLRPAFAGLPPAEWTSGLRRLAARLEGLAQAGLVASALATALALLLQVLLVASLTGGDLGLGSLEAVIASSFGAWHLLRFPLLGALVVLLVRRIRHESLAGVAGGKGRPPSAWWFSWGVIALGLLATTSLSGHAAVADPVAVALVNDVVHLAAGATWFTGIVVLAVALPDAWRGGEELDRLALLAEAVGRFSRVALVSIVVVAVTGALNSFLNVGSFGDLLSSGYGRALALKIGLFVVVLGLGGINHLYIRRRLRAAARSGTPTRSQSLFRKTIALELAVGIAVLGVTGLLAGFARTRDDAPERDTISSSRSF
jgi:copper transport protein